MKLSLLPLLKVPVAVFNQRGAVYILLVLLHSICLASLQNNQTTVVQSLLRQYDAESTRVVVVLVTSGYIDMLMNHLCSVRKSNVDVIDAQSSSVITLVITNSAEVKAITDLHSLLCIMNPSPATYSYSSADFGTLAYQELILFRTEVVLDILKAGFSAVVADIDTGKPLNTAIQSLKSFALTLFE